MIFQIFLDLIIDIQLGILLGVSVPFIVLGIFSKKVDKKYKFFLIYSIALSLLLLCNPIWKLLKNLLNFMQFKWRALSFLTVILSISICAVIKGFFENNKKLLNIIFYIILIISISFSIQFLDYENKHGRLTDLEDLYTNMYSKAISLGGGKEYLPIEVNYEKLKTPSFAISNLPNPIPVNKEKAKYLIENKNHEISYYELPIIYYKGYKAILKNENNEKINLKLEKTENGLVKINLKENENIGKIIVWYNGTTIQKISYIISFSSLLILIFYYFRHKNKT